LIDLLAAELWSGGLSRTPSPFVKEINENKILNPIAVSRSEVGIMLVDLKEVIF
jgi:hypothetical protein